MEVGAIGERIITVVSSVDPLLGVSKDYVPVQTLLLKLVVPIASESTRRR